MKNLAKGLLAVLGIVLLGALGTTPLMAQTLDDPLHGFCWGVTPVCSDAGSATPTFTNPPNFGFTVSPGSTPLTGDYLIEVLVPNNESASSFAITGTQGGTANTSAISASATLFSSTAWTGGQLDTYLGISGSPTNTLDNFLGCTQNPTTPTCGGTGSGDPSASGYFVFQADLGRTQLQSNSSALSGPLLTISTLPADSFIVGFLNTGTSPFVATASSNAIFESGTATPEPASMLLLGTGLVAFGGMLRRKKTANQ